MYNTNFDSSLIDWEFIYIKLKHSHKVSNSEISARGSLSQATVQ